jgi:transposase
MIDGIFFYLFGLVFVILAYWFFYRRGNLMLQDWADINGFEILSEERFETGSNISVICALTLGGVGAPMMIEGPIDGKVLERYIEQFLPPELRPGDIVLWDNVAPHKNKRAIELIEGKGARIEPLPADSPDLNPIEECISKVETEVRRAKAGTVRKLGNAVKRAFARVRTQDARGWFNHCGYVMT